LASRNDGFALWRGKIRRNSLQVASQAGKQVAQPPSTPMADREDKNSSNVSGKFYVDSQCIDCDLCRETAPNNFARAENEGYSYVFKQPDNDEETAQCCEAMEGCPVEAIGDDGED
jgi:ferredoxin